MSSRATGGAEVRVNTVTTSNQLFPTIAMLRDGGWIVTWTSDAEDGSFYGIYQQRYDARGNPVGAAERVNSFALADQYESVVTGLVDGGWVVSWASAAQDGSGFGIYQQRYAADGLPVGPEHQVNMDSIDDQAFPAVTSLADGGWVTIWQSTNQDGTVENVYQLRYDADGLPVEIETLVNTTTADTQSEPAVTALADGGWLVTWSSYDQDNAGDYGIYQQRYDASGVPTGEETRVNTYPVGDQNTSQVSALPDGGWLVVWVSFIQDGSGDGIYMQRFDASGAADGPEARVNLTTVSHQLEPDVAVLSDGGWVVVWRGFDGLGQGLFQQRYSADGQLVGGETRVELNIGLSQYNPQIIATPDGGWTVVWETIGQDGDGYGVYQRHFAPDILGTIGADALVGTHWDELLVGYSGNDTLNGAGGADVLSGGFGDDLYFVDSATDDVQELVNQGNDTVIASASYSIVNDAIESLTLTGSANINAVGNGLANVLTGNAGNNTLTANNGNDTLDGGEGNDILNAGGGADTLTGGAGNDRLAAGAGRDTANYASTAMGVTVTLALITAQDTIGAGIDTVLDVENLIGSGFNDTLTGNDETNVIEGLGGNDTINGGAGIDTASYASAAAGVTVRLALAGAQNTLGAGTDTLANFENLIGSAHNDTLVGDTGVNILEGGLGNDVLNGGGGLDTATYASAAAGVAVDLTIAGAQVTGNGSDTLTSIENLLGSAYDDVLRGSAGINRLDGGRGNDTIFGGGGGDTLVGGIGRDTLIGNGGADRFVFGDGDMGQTGATADIIADFTSAAGDRMILSGIDANTSAAGDQAFAFIGAAAFSSVAGQLRYFDDGTNTFIAGDTNGDGFADFVIRVDGLVPLVGADFVL